MGVNPKSNNMILEVAAQLNPPVSMIILGSQIMRPKIREQFKSAKLHYETKTDLFSEVVCIDTNGRLGCLDRDLSEPLKDMHESFDVLYNGGTLEHIAKQQEAWRNAHYLLRQGGVAIHVCPLINGWLNHGRYLYSGDFFDALIDANKYKILIVPEVVEHRKGKAIYLAFQKEKKSVFYWKQAEPHIKRQKRA